MSPTLTFTALGVPIPKGSTRAFIVKGRPVITAANAKTKPWQEIVTWAAVEARQAQGWTIAGPGTPVELTLDFYVPRPKSAPKAVTLPCKKPDLDKLVRAVKDALTRAGIYEDDSQVVELNAGKLFAGGTYDPDGLPRVVVQVAVYAR